jgi:hypothetical protein
MANDYELERERRIAQNKAKLAVSRPRRPGGAGTRQAAGAAQQRSARPHPAPAARPRAQELGVNDSVEAVLASKPAKAKPAKRKAAPAGSEGEGEPGEVRRSARPRAEVSYVYKEERGEGGGREPVDYTEKIKSLQIEAEEAEKLRAELEAKRAGSGDKKERGGAKNRGPKDSGKGVRVQVGARGAAPPARGRPAGQQRGGSAANPRPRRGAGRAADCWRAAAAAAAAAPLHARALPTPSPPPQGGRVYDSKFGVTCHWCRQKTLEAHVTCTDPKCGKGKMPYSFWCAGGRGVGAWKAAGSREARRRRSRRRIRQHAQPRAHAPSLHPCSPRRAATSASRTGMARTPRLRPRAAAGSAPPAAGRAAPAACSAATAGRAARRCGPRGAPAWLCTRMPSRLPRPPLRGRVPTAWPPLPRRSPLARQANLEPTAQIVFLARSAGFSNVHDYLVHLVTGEKEEDIAARKAKFAWGAFLRGGDASDASAQTAAGGSGSGAAEDEEGGRDAAGAEEEEEPEPEPAPKKRAGAKGGRRASGARAGSSSGSKGSSVADASPAPEAQAQASGGKAAGGRRGRKSTGSDDDAAASRDVGGPADQDRPRDAAKASRKARMMQRMGLAPREELEAA